MSSRKNKQLRKTYARLGERRPSREQDEAVSHATKIIRQLNHRSAVFIARQKSAEERS